MQGLVLLHERNGLGPGGGHFGVQLSQRGGVHKEGFLVQVVLVHVGHGVDLLILAPQGGEGSLALVHGHPVGHIVGIVAQVQENAGLGVVIDVVLHGGHPQDVRDVAGAAQHVQLIQPVTPAQQLPLDLHAAAGGIAVGLHHDGGLVILHAQVGSQTMIDDLFLIVVGQQGICQRRNCAEQHHSRQENGN